MDRESLKSLLLKHEGTVLKPYFDCCGKFFRDCECENQGKLTIGTGRNIEDQGITDQEASYLLENDMGTVVGQCRLTFPWFNNLCDVRQNVVCDMVFNLGMDKFREFVKLLKAIADEDFEEAANQMLQSNWAGQVGSRAVELSKMMKVGSTYH